MGKNRVENTMSLKPIMKPTEKLLIGPFDKPHPAVVVISWKIWS